MTIEMVSLTSSNLHSAGYDPDSETLRIAFHRGGVVTSTWDYRPVPQALFEQLLEAQSSGRFFNQAIKGIYPATRR